MKMGGIKKYQPGGILTPQGRIKSSRTRNIDLTGRQTTAEVSRTKRNGDTVTKSVNTSRGFVPTASKTKTVTNKAGDVVSKETKNIGYNKAVRKTKRVANNVGRNANDTYAYKKGGAIKKPLRKAQDGKSVYSGPMNEYDSNVIDNSNMSAAAKAKARQPFLNPKNTRNQAVLEAADVMTDESDKYYDQGAIWGNQVPKPGPHVSPYHKKGGAAKKMYKTGGMVNANAKLVADKSAGSKGVKVKVNPKAAASKVAKGRVGGTSVAPKKAIPKAKYGMAMKKSC
jgi:hypothetical protein